MLAHKHITKIVIVLTAIAVCLCLAAMIFSEQLIVAAGGEGITMEYESELFDTNEIIDINIVMAEDEWQKMLDNATAEVYYQCDIEINGKMFYSVGIRPKGNTSLTSIASDPETDRYSFKLEFDQYVDGQTCYGLDKLVLNNNYADATNMKEALIYDMYAYLDADASLYNYAQISVNGEYWGVYLALEAVEDSFLLRNYGVESGELYKPDSMNIGGGDFDAGDMDFGNMTPPESMGENGSFGNFNFSGRGGFGGFSMGGNGTNLNYTDDELDSYSTIWNCEVTNTSESDHKRVVTALKNISEGTELETYMDIDNLLKYMAVHIFSVNSDSLSGMMAHNYYLYEENGQLNIIPWDYNLSLGGMGGGSDATSTVNEAIDNAFSGTRFFDTLMENEEYHEQYYSYMQQLVNEYLLGDGFESFYNRVRNQIDKLVETDPNAFYTYEEYLTAVETLYEVVKLRGESIDGQLSGTIPSISNEQKDSENLIDASHIDLGVMGSMNMGGGGFRGRSSSGKNDNTINEETTNNVKINSSAIKVNQESNEMPEGFDPSQFDGEMPEGFDPSQFGGNSQSSEKKEDNTGDNSDTFKNTSKVFDRNNMPNRFSDSASASKSNLVMYGICIVVLVVALIYAKRYRRKQRK